MGIGPSPGPLIESCGAYSGGLVSLGLRLACTKLGVA